MTKAGHSRATSRIFAGSGANALGKFWITLIQLVSVPVLVTHWGPNDYGLWLMLSVMPSYIALSDLGFGTAGGVDMTRRYALGDRDGALGAFQSVWVFVSSLSFFILVLAGAAWFVADVTGVISGLRPEIVFAAIVLFLYSLALLQTTLVNMVFRSTGRYAQGTFLLDLLIPIEGGAVLLIASLGHGLDIAALCLFGVRLCGLFVYYAILRRQLPWVKWGWSHASRKEITALSKPALAALLLPVAGALNIQGVTFAIGVTISPSAVALFNAVRTLTRVPLQVVSILGRASVPELTASHAKKEFSKFDALSLINIYLSIVVTVPAALLLLLFGDHVLHILSRGHLSASVELFAVMSGVMIFQTCWNAVAIVLVALNLQQRFTYIYLGLSAAALLIFILIAGHIPLAEALVVFVIAEAMMCMVVLRVWKADLGVNLERLSAASSEIVHIMRSIGGPLQAKKFNE